MILAQKDILVESYQFKWINWQVYSLFVRGHAYVKYIVKTQYHFTPAIAVESRTAKGLWQQVSSLAFSSQIFFWFLLSSVVLVRRNSTSCEDKLLLFWHCLFYSCDLLKRFAAFLYFMSSLCQLSLFLSECEVLVVKCVGCCDAVIATCQFASPSNLVSIMKLPCLQTIRFRVLHHPKK